MASEAHAVIRGEVAKLFGPETADHLRILYGGSVKPDNRHHIDERTPTSTEP